MDLPCRGSECTVAAYPQASDHFQVYRVLSAHKETAASDTGKVPGEIITPGV